jgi:hypothetical protein
MEVLVFVKGTEDSEKGLNMTPETVAMMEAMGKFNDELIAAGIMKKPTDCNGLRPSSDSVRIAFDGKNRTVIKGPFTNPRDLVAGYWIWHVKDMDEAIAWAKRCPNPMPGPSELEIRPTYEPEDFQ